MICFELRCHTVPGLKKYRIVIPVKNSLEHDSFKVPLEHDSFKVPTRVQERERERERERLTSNCAFFAVPTARIII